VVGSPAVIKRQLSEQQQKMLELGAYHYVQNGQRYQKELTVVSVEDVLMSASEA